MEPFKWGFDQSDVNLIGRTDRTDGKATAGLDNKHLVYMPIGHVVLKMYMPSKNFHVPSQYLYKPCKVYVHCWKNKYMPRLKIHLPCRTHNHKSLCALRQDLHAPGMQARLNDEPWTDWGGQIGNQLHQHLVTQSELSLDILKMESWTHMGCTANIIKRCHSCFAPISKIMACVFCWWDGVIASAVGV